MTKERLDKLLVEHGFCQSRQQAQGLILAGKVQVLGQVVTKAGTPFDKSLFADDTKVPVVIEMPSPYVSRGGFKLEKAINAFHIHVQDRICLDVGASTGGFTDCLLQQRAQHVYAVDVGYGQLDWQLRQNPRVTCLEKTNAKSLQSDLFQIPPSLAVVDVSFISLKKVIPYISPLLSSECGSKNSDQTRMNPELIVLIKPQFEFKDYLADPSFDGVVKGMDKHLLILEKVVFDLQNLLSDWRFSGLTYSPITGPKGNREFFAYFVKTKEGPNTFIAHEGGVYEQIAAVIKECYAVLPQ